MAFRDDLLKRIEKKKQEIAELESNLREASSYLQALEDTAKMLPRDVGDLTGSQASPDLLRPHSSIAKARDLIRKAGKPLHVEDILKQMGRPLNKSTRAAMSGSIAFYVRKGEIFTKTAPNTFGLKDIKNEWTVRTAPQFSADELPADFGLDELGDRGEESPHN